MTNALLKKIVNEISNIGIMAPQLRNKRVTEKVYEIYVMSCLMRAFKNLGGELEARDENDHQTTNLVFRLAPGYIYSPATRSGFVFIKLGDDEFEIQNSLRVKGYSGILHELDISLIERPIAQILRDSKVHPSYLNVIFLFECKYYGKNLPLHLGREFLGLISEFDCRIEVLVAKQDGDMVRRMVSAHRGTVVLNLKPKGGRDEQRFIRWLENEINQIQGIQN